MWNRIQNLLGSTLLKKFNNKTVAIIGLGSLGSEVAVQLAKSGIGNFILIDPDTLEEHNVVRHAADLSQVGRYKVDAVKSLLQLRNKHVNVKTVVGDVRQNHEVLAHADLIIVAGLGSEIAQQQVGKLIRTYEKPALFGGAYTRAVAGEVLFVDAVDGPCYSCFATILRDVIASEEVQIDYGMPPDEVKAEPGLGLHVLRIAIVVADWALRILAAGEQLNPFPGNLVILSNEEYSLGTNNDGNSLMLPPSSSKWYMISQKPTCLTCSTESLEFEGTLDDLLAS